jgi:hypothetical protein
MAGVSGVEGVVLRDNSDGFQGRPSRQKIFVDQVKNIWKKSKKRGCPKEGKALE